MARRSDHTRAQLKEMAVTAGLEIVRDGGWAASAPGGVAARIGYTVGTLYHVFGSYDDLVLAMNARTLDHWFEYTGRALRGRAKGGDPIRALARSYIRYSRAHPNEWLALFELRIAEDKRIPAWYAAKMARFFDLLEGLLLPALRNDRKKAKRAARVLWAGIHGICILAMSKKLDMVGSESAGTLAESLVDNYMAGLARRGVKARR